MISMRHLTRVSFLSNQGAVFVGCQHAMSTASTEAKPQRINKNLSFRPAYDSAHPQKDRPLVLIYGWLVAKSKHIHKYGDFYLGKGFDVLHIKVDPIQLMWPLRAQKIVGNILNFVAEDHRQNQPLLVHGFSVGGYLYGETLVQLHSEPRLQAIGERIQGQIFDSPVDVHGIPSGFSQAVTSNPILQKVLENSLHGYMKIFSNKVTTHYNKSSDMFHANNFMTPSCFLYSAADPVGAAGPIEHVMERWEAKGILVDKKKWEETPHVSHFHYHPVQYITKLNEFLAKIGLEKDQKEKIVLSDRKVALGSNTFE